MKKPKGLNKPRAGKSSPASTGIESLKISKPAKRALLNSGIRTVADLSKRTMDEVKSFHGIGPSAIVRNPMCASAAVYLIGVPLALGSYWGLIPAVLTILGLVWRLLDEEKFLAQNLPGYTEYCAKVRWHLIPGSF